MKNNYSKSLFFVLFLIPFLAFGQLKKDTKKPDFTNILAKPADSFLLGFLDPSKFQMNHSFNMSFGMGGGQQMLQNAYINTMFFQFSDNLTLSTDIGIMQTPYHTFGQNSSLNNPQFFGGAQLDYKISENSHLQLRFESVPASYFNQRNQFYNPFYRSNYFDRGNRTY
ncbi:MAG: hypothetical protein D8M58_04905 [Calditrichaeota bacterium]|nr:MAG: hypothetical protein DWQ03_02170 [Calditrichota bacterium]MBL1204712.1 hypothetical protein [Calditrichota bacterium]NOG44540.1 hypothetical protein [Calditrichota bacterium]